MKRMLINATQAEELRVAMVDGQRLYDLDIEVPSKEQKKANIYKGRITRVEQSLEAAFVDYGQERHGFLPLKEISREYFRPEFRDAPEGKFSMKEAVPEGIEIVVQVEKEERGNKGAALTTFISLAGRFLVLMPNNPRAGGVSRRAEGDDRDEMREVMADLKVPDNMGMIVRTAGVGRTVEELQWDLDYLMQIWTGVDAAAKARPAPFLIYQESNLFIRALRDYLRNDIGEILIDDAETYDLAHEFVSKVMPHNIGKLKAYSDRIPLFTRYQIESQIETAFRRDVRLPSGGAMVVDHTEALVSIDINSARATRGSDIEETALNTNLEAADEIARQLRLRDMGGLIVIDFIDMSASRNQKAVEDRLRDATRNDRARIQIGKLSRFGLLEMSRQRLRPALTESSQIVCPRCRGEGRIRGVESLALAVLRLIEEESMKERTARVVAQVPVEVATYLLNEKRAPIVSIEKRTDVQVVIVANQHMDTPDYEIRRVRDDEIKNPQNSQHSFRMTTVVTDEAAKKYIEDPGKAPTEQAAVSRVLPATAVPTPVAAPAAPTAAAPAAQGPGFFVRLWRSMFGTGGASAPAPRREGERGREPRRDRNERGDRGDRHGGRGGRDRDHRRDRDRGGERSDRPARRDEPRREGGRDGRNEPRRDGRPGGNNPSRGQGQPDRAPQQAQAERPPQPPREQRPPQEPRRDERPSTSAPEGAAAVAGANASANGDEARRSRRGRRGGRRRRGRGAGERTEGMPANGNAAVAAGAMVVAGHEGAGHDAPVAPHHDHAQENAHHDDHAHDHAADDHGFEGYERVGDAPRSEHQSAQVEHPASHGHDPELTVPNVVQRETPPPAPVAFEPPAPPAARPEPTPSDDGASDPSSTNGSN